jgi:hypothetical protein
LEVLYPNGSKEIYTYKHNEWFQPPDTFLGPKGEAPPRKLSEKELTTLHDLGMEGTLGDEVEITLEDTKEHFIEDNFTIFSEALPKDAFLTIGVLGSTLISFTRPSDKSIILILRISEEKTCRIQAHDRDPFRDAEAVQVVHQCLNFIEKFNLQVDP